MAGSEQPGFAATGGPDFARIGLAGKPVWIGNEGSGLILRGPDGRVLRIPIEQVERLRLGFEKSRQRRYYMARLFLVGGDRPLFIMPMQGHASGYAEVMRRFAHAVAEAGGLSRIERGLTMARMIFFIVLFAVLVLSAATVFLLYGTGDRLAGPLSFAGAMAVVIALYAWLSVRSEMPRPMTSLEEIERFLPG